MVIFDHYCGAEQQSVGSSSCMADSPGSLVNAQPISSSSKLWALKRLKSSGTL
jgi:hypothetical protein